MKGIMIAVLLGGCLLSTGVAAEDATLLGNQTAAKIRVSDITMPKVPPVSRTAAIYLTLENLSDEAVELIDVATVAASHAMLHQTIQEAGIAKMRHANNLVIPARGRLELRPGSYHIMLMGLDKEKLAKPFEVSLILLNKPAVTVIVTP